MLLWCYLCSQNSGTIKMNSDIKKPWTSNALLLVLFFDDEDMLSVRRHMGTGRREMVKKNIIKIVTGFMGGFLCVPI